jgi:hypothetical protein
MDNSPDLFVFFSILTFVSVFFSVAKVGYDNN